MKDNDYAMHDFIREIENSSTESQEKTDAVVMYKTFYKLSDTQKGMQVL